jgi:hypothetical protein
MNKKYIISFAFLGMMTLLSSCFEDMTIRFDKPGLVEFESAVRTAPAAGAIYPIIATTRTAGTLPLQVNLVGAHLKAAEEMTVTVDTAISKFLNATTIRAVEGTHFSLNGGKVVMKADTSFGVYRFGVQNVAPVAGRFALVVLKLEDGNTLKASENYRRVGYRIALQ